MGVAGALAQSKPAIYCLVHSLNLNQPYYLVHSLNLNQPYYLVHILISLYFSIILPVYSIEHMILCGSVLMKREPVGELIMNQAM